MPLRNIAATRLSMPSRTISSTRTRRSRTRRRRGDEARRATKSRTFLRFPLLASGAPNSVTGFPVDVTTSSARSASVTSRAAPSASPQRTRPPRTRRASAAARTRRLAGGGPGSKDGVEERLRRLLLRPDERVARARSSRGSAAASPATRRAGRSRQVPSPPASWARARMGWVEPPSAHLAPTRSFHPNEHASIAAHAFSTNSPAPTPYDGSAMSSRWCLMPSRSASGVESEPGVQAARPPADDRARRCRPSLMSGRPPRGVSRVLPTAVGPSRWPDLARKPQGHSVEAACSSAAPSSSTPPAGDKPASACAWGRLHARRAMGRATARHDRLAGRRRSRRATSRQMETRLDAGGAPRRSRAVRRR